MKGKKWFKAFSLIIIPLLVLSVGYYFYDRSRIGTGIDSYKGVDVYYNGIFYTQAHGKNYSEDNYYLGQKWQCVEYIKRFFHKAKGHKMPDVYGNAGDFFDVNAEHGELNEKRGLVQYMNGGDEAPKPDDLLVFNDTKFGHVAIVTEVTETYIEVIQQNVPGKTRERFTLVEYEGNYTVGDKRKPAGWLRKE